MPFDNLPEPRPSREVQLLRLARDSIGSSGRWIRGAWIKDGRMCAVMAIQSTCAINVARTDRRQMVRRLIRLVEHEAPLRQRIVFFFLTARQRLIWYNDARWTTHQEIMGLFHRAIEQQEISDAKTNATWVYPGL